MAGSLQLHTLFCRLTPPQATWGCSLTLQPLSLPPGAVATVQQLGAVYGVGGRFVFQQKLSVFSCMRSKLVALAVRSVFTSLAGFPIALLP
jgi:hypothetical protein